MKNILPTLIMAISGIFAYGQFNVSNAKTDCLPSTKKMSPQKIIKMAEIHGISLITPISNIDGLLNNAGYQCKKSESSASTASSKSSGKDWKCTHNKLRSTFHISTGDGQIETITRSGEATLKDMDFALDMAGYLKSLSNTREGISVIQNPQMAMYTISFKKENRHLTASKYQINYARPKAGADEIGGLLNVMIAR